MLAPAPPFRLFLGPNKTTLTIIRDVILIWHRRQRRRADILDSFFPWAIIIRWRESRVWCVFNIRRNSIPFSHNINRMKLEEKFDRIGWCRLLTIHNVLLILYQLSSRWSIIYISRARFALVQQINYHFLGCWVSSTLKLRVAMSSDAAATVFFGIDRKLTIIMDEKVHSQQQTIMTTSANKTRYFAKLVVLADVY